MHILHPCLDENGKPLILRNPSRGTMPQSWHAPDMIATVVPGAAVPSSLHGIDFCAGQLTVNDPVAIDEPPFVLPAGKAPAAGIAIVESDGRIWLVSPSNQFGGYANTVPKGRVEPGLGLQATAVREAYEESGLLAEVTGFLVDCVRTQTFTRFYIGRRVGGSPALMGWESQAVHLVPLADLASMLAHPNDAPVLAALKACRS